VLEKAARHYDIDFWGYGAESLRSTSPIKKNFHGSAWGLDMYRIRASARIVVNGHSSAAEGYANNMCLFETTGVGSLLVTDAKRNLSDLFEVGAEVVSYENADDCVEKLAFYLANDEARARLACAGQERTLREHTYRHRMSELIEILDRSIV
jgi:spore maturation protein CgeB